MATINSAFVDEASAARASRGLRIEGVTEFWPGAILYRFFQRSDTRDADCIKSPWWFQGSSIRRILSAARDGAGGSSSVATQAARKAGLSEAWADSGANYLLCARVAAPISVLWGPPRPIGKLVGSDVVSGLADGADVDEVEVVPDPLCVQFYVPGMWQPEIAAKAVRIRSRTKFKHALELEQGEIEAFLRRVSAG